MRPRLLLMAAGPGWGKTFLSRELCAKATFPAMVEFNGCTSYEEAQRRLARTDSGMDQKSHDVIVLEDADIFLALGGSDDLHRLMKSLPASTMLVLTSALPLEGFNPHSDFAPHEILTLRRDAFEFSRDEALEIIGDAYLSSALLDRAILLAQGWPILVLLFARIARAGQLEEALNDHASWVLDPYHQYLKNRVFNRLQPEEIATLTAIAALGSGDADEISAALGSDARATLARMEHYRYYSLRLKNGIYSLTEMPEGALRALFAEEVRAMRVRAATLLHNTGKHVRAAKLALEAKEYALAATCLDATGRRGAGEAESLDYVAVAEGLPLTYIFRSHYVLLEVLNSRHLRAKPYPLYARVREFCETMTPDLEPFVRFSASIAYTVLLRLTLRGKEAEAQARECEKMLAGFPHAHDRVAMLRAVSAVIVANQGRVDDAEVLWQSLAEIEGQWQAWFPYHRFAIDVAQALYRGDSDRVAQLSDENVHTAKLHGDQMAVVHAQMLAVFNSATLSETGLQQLRSALSRAMSELSAEEYEFPGQVTDPFEARERYIGLLEALLGVLTALCQSDPDLARRLIAECVAAFDRVGYPYWQIIGRLAAAQIPQADRKALLDQCVSLVGAMQVPAARAQIRALADGSDLQGPFSAFLKTIAKSPLCAQSTMVRARLLDRKVTRDGRELKVRQREFELLVHLALAGGPVSVESLCEALWPDSEESAAVAALRMSVHRLRKQLDDNSSVLNVAAGYQIAPSISVDVLEAENAYAALRRLPRLNDDDRTALHALFQYVCSVGGEIGGNESWHERVARRIEDLRHSAGSMLSKEYMRLGEPLRALEVAEMLLRYDPLDEEAVGLCVKSLTASGDKTAATRLWHQYVKRLSVDYGTKPTVSMMELVGSEA